MDQPVVLHSVLCKECAKSACCCAGRRSPLDFPFACGRRQLSLGARGPKAFIQATYRLERGEKAFKAFCFRSFIDLALSGLIVVLRSSCVITMCTYTHTCEQEPP